MIKDISQLPTRYEPLVSTFGERAKTTFVAPEKDIAILKTLIARMESSRQSKIMFLLAPTGSGKTTFIHSLEIFLTDKVTNVDRLPPGHSLSVLEISAYLAALPIKKGITIINFDGREAPAFDEAEYRTFLVQLNAILRMRNDLLILWPVNQREFAEKMVALQEEIGGRSAFGANSIYEMKGLSKPQFKVVLEKILQLANWHLDDAAVSWSEVEKQEQATNSIGSYLDGVQELISERFDTGKIGIIPPEVVFVLSSGLPTIRDVCRNLRRADSYYVEASRLLMYTKRSNVVEWWQERNKELTTALPYIVALLNAQLISVSGSTVVHSVMQYGPTDLSDLLKNAQKNMGNAKKVASSSELYKYSLGQEVDNREYGLTVKGETKDFYAILQSHSKTHHKEINQSVVKLINSTGGKLINPSYEVVVGLDRGLMVDVQCDRVGERVNLEFHHKAESEATNNKVAIYILEKLKEYAINYGLAKP